MAGDIRGITIELSAEDKNINAVLKQITSASRTATAQLNAMKKSLKLDYNSSDMATAMELSAKKIEFAKNKVDQLKIAMDNLQKSGKGTPKEFSDLSTEITKAENALKLAEAEYKNLGKMKLNIDTKDFQSKLAESKKNISATKQELDLLNEKLKVKYDSGTFAQAAQKNKQLISELNAQAALYNEQLARMDAAGVDKNSAQYRKLQSELAGVRSEAAAAEKALEQMANIRFEQFADNLGKAGKTLEDVGGKLTTKITVPLLAAGAASTAAAINFEDGFANVEKTVNGTAEELAGIRQEIIDLSSVTPSSTAELNELAATAGQLGIKTPAIMKFTEMMAKMETATNIAGEGGASAMAKFANITKMSQNDFDRLGSSIVDLGNNSATTENDILQMATRMAAAGTQVKMSQADIVGMAAALSSVGLESESGGTAFSKLVVKMQMACEQGGESLEQFANVSGMTGEQFKQAFEQDAAQAIASFFTGLSDTDNLGQSTISMLSEMGIEEVRLRDMILRASNANDIFNNSLKMSREAWNSNTALSNEYEKKLATTASQIKIAKNNITNAAASFGEVLLPSIRDASSGAAEFMQKLAGLDEGTKKNIVSAGLMAAAVGPVTKGLGTAATAGSKVVSTGIKLAGTLGLTVPQLGLVAGGIALVGAGLIAGKKAYENYQHAQLNFSKDLADTSASLVETTNQYKELNDLQSEYNDLSGKVKGGKFAGEELENAKARLEEITRIFAEKYKINVDTGDIDKAVEHAKELKRYEMVSQRSDLVSQMGTMDNGAYGRLNAKIADNTQNLGDVTTQMTNNIKAQNIIEGLIDDWNALTLEQQSSLDIQKEFNDKLNEAAHAGGLPETFEYTDNVFGKAKSDLEVAYAGLNKQAQELRDTINEDSQSAENFRQAAENLAQVGLAELGLGDTANGFEDISLAIQKANLSVDEYAKKAAQVQTGTDLKKVWDMVPEDGGAALNGFVEQYISNMKKFGASAEETALGAAEIKQGFNDLSEVPKEQFDALSQEATAFLKSMEGMENMSIHIDDSGAVSVIDDVSGKIREISNDSVTVSVNAEGDVSVIDEATGKAQILAGLGDVHISVNSEGNIEILDEAEEKIATINGKSGEITVNGEYDGAADIQQAISDGENVKDKTANLTATGTYPGKEEIAQALSDQANLRSKNVTYTVTYSQVGTPPKQQAEGTQNFEGGLAMVNDQKGISDPRELVIDRGKAFIPQGRDVIMPLSKGAKVYTARQTKRIMNNMGIPRYAAGKNNSDAFTSAKDDWTHYTKTHAVTISKELEKWEEFSGKFTDNLKDAQDIEEEIYSLTVKQRDEINELSEDYINTRVFMNDWEAWGDSAIDAFGRVRDREMQYVNDGIVTAEESKDYLEKLGADMYNDRVDNSEAWIKHEKEYNNLSLEGQKEAYERMKQYTQEYYDNSIISYRDYITAMQSYSDAQRDIELEAIDKRVNNSYSWIDKMNTYDAWKSWGDNEVDAYGRILAYLKEYLADGSLSWEKYMEYVEDIQKKIYQSCKETIDNLTDDLEDAYNDRVDALEKSLDDSLDAIDDYNSSRKEKIEEEYNARIDAIQAEIDALEELKEAEDAAADIAKAQKELRAVQTLLEYSRDEDEKAELMKELLRKQNDLDELMREQSTTAKKKEYEAQIDSLEADMKAALAAADEWNEEQKKKAQREYNKAVKNATDEYIQQQYAYTSAIANGETTWAALANYYNNSNVSKNYNTYNSGGNSLTVNNNGNAMTTGQLKLLFQSLYGTY